MSSQLAVVAIILCVVIIIIGVLWLKKHKRRVSVRYKLILEPFVEEEVKRIIIPDGVGGVIEIEHLILLEQGFLVIDTYPIAGNLFGADNIEQWTQIMEGRSYKFINPLHRIQLSRQALKLLAPDIPIFYRVIFSADADFPKGKPAHVSTLETLSADLTYLKSEKPIAQQAQKAWDMVMRIARKDGQAVVREANE